MGNLIYKLFLIVILSLTFTSCNNDDDKNDLESLNGDYSGTFTVVYLNGDTFSNAVTLSFNEGKNYKSSGNGNNNDFYPAGGSGPYEMRNSKITFSDNNIWLAHFDWNLILSGEYGYSINGNELNIFANRTEFGLYKYELLK
ncbi:hypothetical protein PI23P_08345 [Polaribacter irgensii 23-P]|uniref:Lipocalin-like domain-containing protein n=1 Tax=Polaribacter irgensii 23-P TaxID=313594 RepID=A4BZM8_9FLAO|nr:hypothetical protein [Polaribacter irgensii]EAR12621.1 hypothetical protein PI23P_08345 [Polaribacter irgensii 23-P]